MRRDFIQKRISGPAAIHHFSRHKIHGLNAIRALVNRGHPYITAELSSPGFFDKSHSPMHLHTKIRDVNAGIRAKGLRNRSQQSRARRPSGIIARAGHIKGNRIGQCNRSGCKNITAHGQKHSAYIGMINNRAAAVFQHAAPLTALFSVG